MAAERDALVRAALPRLRAMAAPHGVGLSEVDLRWGVDDPDPRRQVELCLEEVTRSDIIVGVLGERYGARAPSPPPQGFPPGRSVTELELRMFLQRWSSAPGPAPALIYIRDPAFLQAVPEELRGIYGAESEEAAAKMAALKEELKGNPAVGAVRSYRCGWGSGGPTALEDFVAQVVADVWDVLQRHFLHGAPPSVQDSFLASQHALGPVARSRLVAATAAAIRRGEGNRLLLTGEPGVGRTVFMAALIGALQQDPPPSASKPLPQCLVAYHFASARPDQSDARVALAQLCARLEELLGKASHAPSEGSTYQELRPRLLALLATPPPKGRRLALLIDDAHFLHVGGTERSDWLPPAVHPRVSLVLSAPATTIPAHFPEVGGAWTPLPLRPLPPPERADLLGAELRRWGRSLERRYVSAVLGKGGAKLPLYQRLLLAELRAFARYEDLPEVLLTAPPTVPRPAAADPSPIGCSPRPRPLALIGRPQRRPLRIGGGAAAAAAGGGASAEGRSQNHVGGNPAGPAPSQDGRRDVGAAEGPAMAAGSMRCPIGHSWIPPLPRWLPIGRSRPDLLEGGAKETPHRWPRPFRQT
ncbi:telomerase protein component 1-like [Lagopus muta]|uniref:telomerase protein component 1-like n=1 Tax=Lagopus muta TaxID=64668 RepID=UPI0020A05B00|nr:telomerase protein component 1-like [Lagopus muta]